MDEALYPLHIGSVGGTAVKWGMALGGLAPGILLVNRLPFLSAPPPIHRQLISNRCPLAGRVGPGRNWNNCSSVIRKAY